MTLFPYTTLFRSEKYGILTKTNRARKGTLAENLEAHEKIKSGMEKKVWNAVWQTTIWNIWLARNEAIYGNKQPSEWEVADRVKAALWISLKAKGKIRDGYNFNDWIFEPARIVIRKDK